MKKIFPLFILFIVSTLQAQIPVWQGFQLDWTYNHRLNRMGSYIYQDSVFTSAATGIGKDSASFNTHYIVIPDKNIEYKEFKIERLIEAKENQLIQIQIDTILPIDYHHSIFYINGFELIALNDADKLQLMELEVKMIKGNNDTTHLRINYNFIFNCQSLECDWINNEVEYDFNLFIGCMSFSDSEYIQYVQGEMFNGNETWTRKNNNPPMKYKGGGNSPRFITDLKIALDKAHWYSGISTYVDASNDVCMKFEQYKPSMKKNAYYKPHANFSKKSKGTAFYQMNGISFNKPVLNKETREFKGSIIWKGNNRSAYNKEAVRCIKIE